MFGNVRMWVAAQPRLVQVAPGGRSFRPGRVRLAVLAGGTHTHDTGIVEWITPAPTAPRVEAEVGVILEHGGLSPSGAPGPTGSVRLTGG